MIASSRFIVVFLLKSSGMPLVPEFNEASLLGAPMEAAGTATDMGGATGAGFSAVSNTSTPVSGFTIRMGFFSELPGGELS